MNHHIVDVLLPDEVQQLTNALATIAFVDGTATAKGHAKKAKSNLQADRSNGALPALEAVVYEGFKRNGDFYAFALPKRMLPPMFCRYDEGMSYGAHVDIALMGGTNGIRGDLAATLFLSDPGSYDGGELVIESIVGNLSIKLPAGQAVIYAAGTVHRVAPVTRGTRLVAVTWIQSGVRDLGVRGILFDLFRAMKLAEPLAETELSLLLDKSYQNLLRANVEL